MSTANRYVDARVIRARLNSNVEKALDIMEQCMSNTSISPKDRYKIASDYLGWFVKIENEIMKAEEHREAMKLRKLTTLIKEVEYEDILEERNKEDQPSNESKFNPTMQKS